MRKPAYRLPPLTWSDVFPFLTWGPKVTPASLRADLSAGITNAAIVLPQGVAFAAIAGLPPEYGLYTAMIPPIIAALFGSSMIMISGPTTAISAVVLAAVSPMHQAGTQDYIETVLLLTILVGAIQLGLGLARVGRLAAFVSNSVMIGFTAAAAVLIGVSQLRGALGIEASTGGSVYDRIAAIIVSASAGVDWRSVLIAGVTLVTLVVLTRYAARLPNFLIALGVGTAAYFWVGGPDLGIATVGSLPSVFPSFSPPSASLEEIGNLMQSATAIALIGLLEAVAIGRSFAPRTHTRFDANQEIVGQGLSNIAGGLFQAYPASGSFTRSGVNYESGARTPLAAVFSCGVLALILLAVAPLISYIPIAAMAGLILYVAWRLVNVAEIRHIIETSKSETAILAITFLTGILVELEFSIFIGVMLSFATFISRTMQPKFAVGAPDRSISQRTFRNAEAFNLPECPQFMICRFDGPLYFGSIDFLEAEFRRIAVERPGQKHIVVNLKGVGDIDLAGVDSIIREARRRKETGGDLYAITKAPHFISRLRRLGLYRSIGEDHIFIDKQVAIATVVPKLDRKICANCSKRVFHECAFMPAPDSDDDEPVEDLEAASADSARKETASPVSATREKDPDLHPS
ncbi:MAG: SulP family inorganic anion transporter [Pseudomonadota bacterium]